MIEGVLFRELKRNEDTRGWLAEIFRNDALDGFLSPVMGYLSLTALGISRGPHEHLEQTDFFCFPGVSSFRVYLWDNRKNNRNYREKLILETSDKPCILIIPPRIVHAYKNTGNVPGLVLNLPNRLYRGFGKKQEVDEVRYEHVPDSEFKID